ncbi:MAG: hypothetical protein WC325_11785 [Candidatus Bathyarchaeia archaeon]|jgi:hypothetical protein
MNIVIKALSITTLVLWIIILFFSATAAFSVMGIQVAVGEPEMLPSSRGISFSLPFTINNGGYYEIADLNLTTRVTDPTGLIIDQTQTFIESIPTGENITESHTIAVDIDEILSLDHTTLLMEDSEFNVEIFAGFNYARAVPVQLELNTTIPWGAPFANFNVGTASVSLYNSTHSRIQIPISFENHAILDITGKLKLEFYNSFNQKIVSVETAVNVESQHHYSTNLVLYPHTEAVPQLTSGGDVHIIFETPMFTVDWWESL